jgi:trehalose-phosphatase
LTTTIATICSVPERSVVKKIDSETLVLTFPFSTHAILLDIDGTLLDLAATPAGVQVPSSLQAVLTTLWKWTGGALALVSGRPLKDIDRIFAPLELPAIGGHGAELRIEASNENVMRPAPLLEERLRRQLISLISKGMIAEDKGHSIALHYRSCPERGDDLHDAVKRILSAAPNGSYEILPGKFVIEVKPTGFNKGTAVLELMEMSPFKGRTPPRSSTSVIGPHFPAPRRCSWATTSPMTQCLQYCPILRASGFRWAASFRASPMFSKILKKSASGFHRLQRRSRTNEGDRPKSRRDRKLPNIRARR